MKTPTQLKSMFKTAGILLGILFISIISAQSLSAQGVFKLSNSPDNVVKVLGSSNIHDWSMVAQNPTCEADFGSLNDEGIPKSLKSFSFAVDAKNLKSEHKSMDGRTYKTIKADDYPKIIFKLSSASITALQKSKFSIKATGTLTIAGVSQVITMLVNGEVNSDKTITCTGQEKIKLTDYKISPPSFMLGAMKVANDLTVQYAINLIKTNQFTSINK